MRTGSICSLILIITILLSVAVTSGQEKTSTPNGKSMEKPKMHEFGKNGNPIVIMKTSMGNVKIELLQDSAPVSVKNFLSYVDEKFYDNTVFHRVIRGFMIQGGGFTAADPIKQKKNKAPITNEASNGLKNERGTLAMARTSDPNSATSQFFINTVNNASLNPGTADPAGYAVFGKVVDGMDVIDKIESVPTANAPAIALSGGKEVPTTFQNVPKTKIVVLSVHRAESTK
jgi:peptidyl-prolyl cis-trans isomerase A (cyclophilin A)